MASYDKDNDFSDSDYVQFAAFSFPGIERVPQYSIYSGSLFPNLMLS